MSYTLDPLLDNCYPGTTVLINKFDIRNQKQLDEIETILVTAKSAKWAVSPIVDSFDFAHYKAIHHFLFSDLYDWAGEVRTVNISKKGTAFCSVNKINAQAIAIFQRLQEEKFFKGLAHDEFVEQITDFYCTTNDLHPFREGNGRTQRVFLSQLIRNADYDIHWSEIDTDLLMIATIQAAQGIMVPKNQTTSCKKIVNMVY